MIISSPLIASLCVIVTFIFQAQKYQSYTCNIIISSVSCIKIYKYDQSVLLLEYNSSRYILYVKNNLLRIATDLKRIFPNRIIKMNGIVYLWMDCHLPHQTHHHSNVQSVFLFKIKCLYHLSWKGRTDHKKRSTPGKTGTILIRSDTLTHAC